jgi:hypothetical protein
MAEQTAEESRKECIAKMGEPLGSLYWGLWQHLAMTYSHWKQYVELYGTKETRIDLLNRAAPQFFRMIQDELFEVILLHLSRITDPAYSFGKKEKSNLSIQALAEHIADTTRKAEVENLVDHALKATEFAHAWRNRHVAHKDLKLALDQETSTALPDASRKQVKEALNSISTVLNLVAKHYLDSGTAFAAVASFQGAESLLYVLHAGLKARDEQLKRLEAGEPLEGDFDTPDL